MIYTFCLTSFFGGIGILVLVAEFGEIGNQLPLIIWTTGMAVGAVAAAIRTGGT